MFLLSEEQVPVADRLYCERKKQERGGTQCMHRREDLQGLCMRAHTGKKDTLEKAETIINITQRNLNAWLRKAMEDRNMLLASFAHTGCSEFIRRPSPVWPDSKNLLQRISSQQKDNINRPAGTH